VPREMFRTTDRDGKKHQICNGIENTRSIIDELKGFLRPDADLARDGKGERDDADEEDGVDRGFAPRLKSREPGGKMWSQPATIGRRVLPVK
jgi:hypothetical protein